jgi:hypothetical protein
MIVDVYDLQDEQGEGSSAIDGEAEGAADDRIAEQFRREFMDAMIQRRRRRPAQTTKKAQDAEVLKGPKLGGSRNTRAAMREVLLKEQAVRKR